jgi:cyclic pyranopterin phosphate synthase
LARSPTGRSAAKPAAKAGGTRAAKSAAKQGESHFTHFDEAGRARMVDVAGKDITHRVARATGRIVMAGATLAMIRDGRASKGDVLLVARVAAVLLGRHRVGLPELLHVRAVVEAARARGYDAVDGYDRLAVSVVPGDDAPDAECHGCS